MYAIKYTRKYSHVSIIIIQFFLTLILNIILKTCENLANKNENFLEKNRIHAQLETYKNPMTHILRH